MKRIIFLVMFVMLASIGFSQNNPVNEISFYELECQECSILKSHTLHGPNPNRSVVGIGEEIIVKLDQVDCSEVASWYVHQGNAKIVQSDRFSAKVKVGYTASDVIIGAEIDDLGGMCSLNYPTQLFSKKYEV